MASNIYIKFSFASAISTFVLFHQLITNSVQCQQKDEVIFHDPNELWVLQQTWYAWNNTPNVESNLAGWRDFGDSRNRSYYGFYNDDPCFGRHWRGLLCTRTSMTEAQVRARFRGSNTTYNTSSVDYFKASITGLVLDGVSISGHLPDTAKILMSLLSGMEVLILTGNPNLTGSIPYANGSTMLILDLHGNNFEGAVPWIALYKNTEYIDLSNNQLSGRLLLNELNTQTLHTLKLSHNNFSGSVVSKRWCNNLVTVDLSSNKFTGRFWNLTKSIYLNFMNVSNNFLNGQIDSSSFNSSGMPNFRVFDLSYNNFTGAMPNLSCLWALQTLDLSWNNFTSEPFPNWLMQLSSLQALAMSGNNLIGEFYPSVLNNLTSLRTLMLDDNKINGTLNIGPSIQNTSLQLISMRNNHITSVKFNSSSIEDLGKMVVFDLNGNPYCSDSTQRIDLQRCVCEGYCVDSHEIGSTKSITKVIVIASTISMTVISMVVIIASVLFWRNRRERLDLLHVVHQKFAEYELKPTLFAYNDLQKATHNFHPALKLGQGGFGAVYKGTFSDGSIVAVKQLLTPTQQNMEDFLNEVVLLTSVKHRNLVKLKGCCVRGKQRLLVYEYLENSDLANLLFEHKGHQILSWPIRFNICLGVAQGLHYLHDLVDHKIIHRDIKSQNILLDKNLQAKIADFGLALLFPDNETHIMTSNVAGTRGYLAPEYATLGQLSEKVDIYSFGALALEMVSGRRNIDLKFDGDKSYLLPWALEAYREGNSMELVDHELVLSRNEVVEVQRVIDIAILCLHTEGNKRPTMIQVLAMLQGDLEVEAVDCYSSEGDPFDLLETNLEGGSSRSSIDFAHEENLSLNRSFSTANVSRANWNRSTKISERLP